MVRKKAKVPASKGGKLAIKYVAPGDLVPYNRNARTHSEAQVAQIVASIKEFGWTNPILVDGKKGVVAGHGRLLAAKALGMEQVPVIELSGLTAAQKRAYVLADNKLAENAGWDFDILAVEFGELKDAGFDVGVIGFDADEVDAFMAPKGGEGDADGAGEGGPGSLAARFGVPPFSVLNAREGWWQDRKRAWIDMGIESELGRGQERLEMAHPATTGTIDFYAQKRALETELGKKLKTKEAQAILEKRGTVVDPRAGQTKRKASASPGGALMPAADYKTKARGDGRGRPIND